MSGATKITAALFDFDGTLAGLTIDFRHMRALVRAELAALLGPEDQSSDRPELPVMELVHAACAGRAPALQAEIARRAEGAISAYEVECAAKSALFPYVEDLLLTLRERGLKTAIVTRNCRAAVERVFPDHAALCGALISRGDVPPEALKPRPGQLQAALTRLDRPAEAAIMVGDHPMDVIAGKAAGCLTGAVLSGHSPRADLEAAGPDRLAGNAAELFAELGLYAGK